MEPITITALAAFLGTCLYKAGEKFSEKAIETVFENKKELADGFIALFKEDIISLGLSDATTSAVVQEHLEANPEIVTKALKKLHENPKLLEDFNEKLKEQTGGMIVNAEKVGNSINTNYGTINQTF